MALIQSNAIADALNSSEWIFPFFEVMHITGFALAIGSIAMVDLRLLGIGMGKQTAGQIVRGTEAWVLWGLGAILISGPILFLSQVNVYVYNWSFRFKMVALVLAILFNFTIHRKVATSNAPAPVAFLVGLISMALWISVVFGGLFIAFE